VPRWLIVLLFDPQQFLGLAKVGVRLVLVAELYARFAALAEGVGALLSGTSQLLLDRNRLIGRFFRPGVITLTCQDVAQSQVVVAKVYAVIPSSGLIFKAACSRATHRSWRLTEWSGFSWCAGMLCKNTAKLLR